MAHRENVIRVDIELKNESAKEKVTDPVCHMDMIRKDAKHQLFREDKTYFFCSQQCMNKFVSDRFRPGQKL